jgi:hypothetical protein
MNLWTEKWHPVLGGAAAVAIVATYHVTTEWQPPASVKDLFGGVINVCAIAIGFLGAAKSILLSIDDKPIVRQLRDVGAFDKVIRYSMNAVNWSFALAAGTGVVLLLDIGAPAGSPGTATSAPKAYSPWVFCVWFGLLVVASLAYYRIIRIFSNLLTFSDRQAG